MTFGDGGSPIFRADDLEDGDHQLMGQVPQLVAGAFEIYYFECVVSLRSLFQTFEWMLKLPSRYRQYNIYG